MPLQKQIKIFLPEKIDDKSNIYLQGKFLEDEKSYKFFVIKCLKSIKSIEQNSYIGIIFRALESRENSKVPNFQENFLEIYLDRNNEVVDIKAKIYGKLEEHPNYLIVKYNIDKFKQLSKNTLEKSSSVEQNEFLQLAKLVKSSHTPSKYERITNSFYKRFLDCFVVICNLVSMIFKPVSVVFENTAVCRHFKDWKKYLLDENYSGSILFDVLMGVLVFFALSYIHQPGKYFMDLTEVRILQFVTIYIKFIY